MLYQTLIFPPVVTQIHKSMTLGCEVHILEAFFFIWYLPCCLMMLDLGQFSDLNYSLELNLKLGLETEIK